MHAGFSSEILLKKAVAIPYSPITMPEWEQRGVNVVLRRDDLMDEQLSGNKFYKLYYNLQYAIENSKTTIVSYGGAYSNHLHALAAAGRQYGIRTLGIIRGEKPKMLSPTLRDAQSKGMQLHFISRGRYQALTTGAEPDYYPANYHVIPEGGANSLGIQGAGAIGAAIAESYTQEYHFVCLACATGGTMAGIVGNLPTSKTVIGFSVLKGHNFEFKPSKITAENQACPWRVIRGFHGGGYGKKLPEQLVHFWREFERINKILIDPVYTLKMLWGIQCLAQQDYWPRNARLIAVHTGGLQGRRGFLKQITW